jgi:hypothetical protein
MQNGSTYFFQEKIILRVRNRVCNSTEELLSSGLFNEVLHHYMDELKQQRSKLLGVFPAGIIGEGQIEILKQTLFYLLNLPAEKVAKLVEGSASFFQDPFLFNEFVEQLYNYWRRQHRLVICDAVFDRLDQRPYRTFNDLVESLMHIIRSAYRNIQENITGDHPKIYRQVSAGAEIGAIALPTQINYPHGLYKILDEVFIIRQVLMYPPMIFNTPTNKREGVFEKVSCSPLEGLKLNPQEWLCYPARVGSLLVMVYFSLELFELGFSLSNLFELANESDLKAKPDAVFLFGVPQSQQEKAFQNQAVFFDDEANGMLVAAIPNADAFAYFGYLKKMILTLHNIQRMKHAALPIHGAIFQISMHGCQPFTMALVGDTGAGKSETIEALRQIAGDEIEDLIIVADDMGSLEINAENQVLAYGTETGAFVRLDDLQKGYALGQIDRSIIMNPDQVNARVVLPITRYEYVTRGWPLDCIFYANNYEPVDINHPAIELFSSVTTALQIFRRGAVMSKGTTSATGMVANYFANIFGPPQYQQLHDQLAQKYFQNFFDQNLYVGQLRTGLAIPGQEQAGPQAAAQALLKFIQHQSINTTRQK